MLNPPLITPETVPLLFGKYSQANLTGEMNMSPKPIPAKMEKKRMN